MHFESESEDDLRRIGFSKEGKLNRPQIQLGLFTTIEGYPLSYEVFEGNKFEGHTFIDILKKFQIRFQLKHKPIVVADRGMLSQANIALLEKEGYSYIIGAKIKTFPNELKDQIANLIFLSNETTHQIEIEKIVKTEDKEKLLIKQRVILSYSTKRAKKDKYLRDKALQKLKDKIEHSPNITKQDLKLSHYAKYLDLEQTEKQQCNITFKLNQKKIDQDAKLDGIKGYITNNFTLKHKEIIEHYQNLWYIEKAFRISKADLQIRPIYHSVAHRIKAHILIAFVSYAIYMEFERRLKIKSVKFPFSKKLLRDIIRHMFAVKTQNGKLLYLEFDEIQQKIYDAIYSS